MSAHIVAEENYCQAITPLMLNILILWKNGITEQTMSLLIQNRLRIPVLRESGGFVVKIKIMSIL